MTIEFSYPVWYVLICILIGMLYSIVFYRKEKLFNEINKIVVYAMGFLRFNSVFILALLILEPLIEIENQIIEKPVLVIAHDNSESLLVNKDSAFINSDYLISLTSFKEQLAEKYEVKTFTFGDEVQSGCLERYECCNGSFPNSKGCEDRYMSNCIPARIDSCNIVDSTQL